MARESDGAGRRRDQVGGEPTGGVPVGREAVDGRGRPGSAGRPGGTSGPGLDGQHAEDVRSDDLSDAPVPDHERLSRCTLSSRAHPEPQFELWGPPAGLLSLARWLRAPSADVVALRGGERDGWERGPSRLALEVTAAGDPGVAVAVDGDRCIFRGDAAALVALAEVFATVGVHALDLRWAPVERRQTLVPGDGPATGSHDAGEPAAVLAAGSPTLTISSAYPLDPVEDGPDVTA